MQMDSETCKKQLRECREQLNAYKVALELVKDHLYEEDWRGALLVAQVAVINDIARMKPDEQ